MAIFAMASCADKTDQELKSKVESYAVVEVSSPLYDALSENDKKIVALFREADERGVAEARAAVEAIESNWTVRVK